MIGWGDGGWGGGGGAVTIPFYHFDHNSFRGGRAFWTQCFLLLSRLLVLRLFFPDHMFVVSETEKII